ncbi:MAG: hypothetical protein SFV53_00700, partial [Rickettsiales bacterium]|nr:hypothetical protein [Rickettsiales bacterium]
EQNEFFDEASIKKIIYDFAIGITDVAKFNKLLANPKILNLLLKGDQQIYIFDNDNTILHHAARNKNDVFPFVVLSFLIDSRDDNLFLLNYKNSYGHSALEYILAGKNTSPNPILNKKNLLLKYFLSLIILSSQEKYLLKNYPSLEDLDFNIKKDIALIKISQDPDQELINLIDRYRRTFGTIHLLNNDYKVSREVFEVIRILEISIDHFSLFSQNENLTIQKLIEIKLENIASLMSDVEQNDESNTLALYSICDFLRSDKRKDFKDDSRFEKILSFAESLLKIGADPNYKVRIEDGFTPLIFYCANFDCPRLTSALIDAGVDCSRVIGAFDILNINARNLNFGNVEAILDRVPQLINRVCKERGNTTLHTILNLALTAVAQEDRKQYCEMARLLITRGAHCEVKNKQNITAKEIIVLLLNQRIIKEDFFTFTPENFKSDSYTTIEYVRKLTKAEIRQQEEKQKAEKLEQEEKQKAEKLEQEEKQKAEKLEQEERENKRRDDLRKLLKSFSSLRNNPTFESLKPIPDSGKITELCLKINEQELQDFEINNGFNLGFLAARFGKFDDVQKLFSKSINLNYCDKNGFSLLAHSVSRKFDQSGEARKITEFLVAQEDLDFDLVKQALSKISISTVQDHLGIITKSKNIIVKFALLEEKAFRTLISELNASFNKVKIGASVKESSKKNLRSFETEVLKIIREKSAVKEIEPQAEIKKLTRAEIEAPKKLNREAKKLKDEELERKIERARINELAKKRLNEVLKKWKPKEIEENELKKVEQEDIILPNSEMLEKESASNIFFRSDRDFTSIEDLPDLLQPIIENLVRNFSKVAIKGSYIYKNHRGEKVENPNDIDLEVFIPFLAIKTNDEIVTIICKNFGINEKDFLGSEPIFKGNNTTITFTNNNNGDEIKIFRSTSPKTFAPQDFTATFKSLKEKVDVSFYDNQLLPNPNLSWTTSIDAKRIVILNNENFSINYTYVDHFKSLYENFSEDR